MNDVGVFMIVIKVECIPLFLMFSKLFGCLMWIDLQLMQYFKMFIIRTCILVDL